MVLRAALCFDLQPGLLVGKPPSHLKHSVLVEDKPVAPIFISATIFCTVYHLSVYTDKDALMYNNHSSAVLLSAMQCCTV